MCNQSADGYTLRMVMPLSRLGITPTDDIYWKQTNKQINMSNAAGAEHKRNAVGEFNFARFIVFRFNDQPYCEIWNIL